jgi:hypothetical protein
MCRHLPHKLLNLKLVRIVPVRHGRTTWTESAGIVWHRGIYELGTCEDEKVLISLLAQFDL